jgi:hypothetical protein
VKTYRQKINALLRENPHTLHELSSALHLSVKEILQHLGHVQKSVRRPQRFFIAPAKCLKCGFVFKDRRKLSPPSRCPRCKDSHIQDPRYGIEGP